MSKRHIPTRAELDHIAWQTIHTASAIGNRQPAGYAATGRPSNFIELAQMMADRDEEMAWSEFLHEFYRFRTPSFFAERPPESLSPQWKALLAGTAEFLSKEFGLPVPEWVNDPQYTLPVQWDRWEDLLQV